KEKHFFFLPKWSNLAMQWQSYEKLSAEQKKNISFFMLTWGDFATMLQNCLKYCPDVLFLSIFH
ncbi:MAG: hypothetical protein IKQ77_11320, partial [Prevotella sp.]|nr:hypothetical protein [Prevotella sp.]